jgi:hypothetical protein
MTNTHDWQYLSAAVFALTLTLSTPLLAQADTAQARAVYTQVNQRLSAMLRSSTQAQRKDVSYRSELIAWSDASGVRKIQATDHDDDGDVVTEYYYLNESLVFVYQAIKGFNEVGQQLTRSEQRQYFQNGKMFKWLGGVEKAAISSSDPSFADEAEARLAASAIFLKAAALPRFSKPPASPSALSKNVPVASNTVKIGEQIKQTIGTITDLQSGDVACYVSLKDEQGKAFEELAEFEICEKSKLLGKRVRLSYVLGSVLADSCQGDPECKDSKIVALIRQATVL